MGLEVDALQRSRPLPCPSPGVPGEGEERGFGVGQFAARDAAAPDGANRGDASLAPLPVLRGRAGEGAVAVRRVNPCMIGD